MGWGGVGKAGEVWAGEGQLLSSRAGSEPSPHLSLLQAVCVAQSRNSNICWLDGCRAGPLEERSLWGSPAPRTISPTCTADKKG